MSGSTEDVHVGEKSPANMGHKAGMGGMAGMNHIGGMGMGDVDEMGDIDDMGGVRDKILEEMSTAATREVVGSGDIAESDKRSDMFDNMDGRNSNLEDDLWPQGSSIRPLQAISTAHWSRIMRTTNMICEKSRISDQKIFLILKKNTLLAESLETPRFQSQKKFTTTSIAKIKHRRVLRHKLNELSGKLKRKSFFKLEFYTSLLRLRYSNPRKFLGLNACVSYSEEPWSISYRSLQLLSEGSEMKTRAVMIGVICPIH
jgi:hypothetical protein